MAARRDGPGSLLLTDDGAETGSGRERQGRRGSKRSHTGLPSLSTLQHMSVSQLKLVCASNGIAVPRDMTVKGDILDLLEEELYTGGSGEADHGPHEMKLIADKKKEVISISDDSDGDFEGVEEEDDDWGKGKKKSKKARR